MTPVSPTPTGQYAQGHALRWFAWFSLSLWVLLALEQQLTAEVHPDSLAEQLYLLRLTGVVAPAVALPWVAAQWLAARFHHGPWFAPVVLSCGLTPVFWRIVAPFASGDGSVRLPMRPLFASLVLMSGCAALVLAVWAVSRVRKAAVALPAGVLLLGALLVFALRLDRTYQAIAGAALVLAAVSLAHVFECALAGPGAVHNRLAAGALAIVLLGFGWGVVSSARLLAGRHLVLTDERAPIAMQRQWFGSVAEAKAATRLSLAGVKKGLCSIPVEPPRLQRLTSEPEQRRNVALVSIAGLRRDVLGMSVAGRRVAPNLFAWANRSQLVPEASAPYPGALLALSGALSGVSASRTLLLPRPPETLFHAVAPRITNRCAFLPATPFFRGSTFKHFVTHGARINFGRTAAKQTDDTLSFVQKARAKTERFMSFTHYGQPRARAVVEQTAKFGGGARGRYFAEVAHVDAEFGRLVAQLEAQGALADTLIIVFGDHGQALGERGYYGDGMFLNGWMTDVPLIVHVPSGAHLTVGTVAQTTDIAPTVLHYLSIAPGPGMTGVSLFGPHAGASRVLVAEAFSLGRRNFEGFVKEPIKSRSELKRRTDLVQRGFGQYPSRVSVRQGRERLIVNRRVGSTTLIDLGRDSGEQRNLSAERPQHVRHLLNRLTEWHEDQNQAVFCALLQAQPKP